VFVRKNIDNKWFFSEPGKILRFLHMYVKGDIIELFPTILFILLLGIWDWHFMILMIGVYIMVRGFGEIVYWLNQQFGDRKYRPDDHRFKQLDNNAIYIIYQNAAIRNTIIGIGIIFFSLIYL